MGKQSRRVTAKQGSPSRRRTAKTADAGGLLAPTDPAMMVMDGSRPHESTLRETTLEDFGLDLLPVIQPHRA